MKTLGAVLLVYAKFLAGAEIKELVALRVANTFLANILNYIYKQIKIK